ncbi:MAG: carboxypeptidase regulatory-like domain-containing protein [Gemmatimonadaceae bacterium]
MRHARRCILFVFVTVWGAMSAVSTRAQAQSARIHGSILDSVARRPLAAAAVQLVHMTDRSRGRSATTDSTGAFRFDDVSPGRYVIGFLHDVLDSLGLEVPSVPISVSDARDYTVPLAIPSAATLVGRLCKADVARDSTGLFIGRLRKASTGAVSPGGVLVSWTELRFTRQGIHRVTPTQRAEAGAEGWFAVCGLPLGSPFVARAWAGTDSSGFVELDLPVGGLLRRDLLVGQATAVVTALTTESVQRRDGLPPTMRHDTTALARSARGAGRLRGTVRVITGAPLVDVRIGVWGTGLQTATDASGAFAIDSVPEGTQTLVARSIGLVPYRAVIDVLPGAPTRHDVTLAPFVAALDTIRVRVDRVVESWRSGFNARRTKGFGEFLDEDEISKRNPIAVHELFRDMPGIDILTSGAFGRKVVMRGRAGGLFCIPAVFVDGLRFYTGQSRPGSSTDMMEYTGTADLEFVVNPLDIKAVEVYTHDSSIPLEFDDPRDGCGSIVIWTGARRQQRR